MAKQSKTMKRSEVLFVNPETRKTLAALVAKHKDEMDPEERRAAAEILGCLRRAKPMGGKGGRHGKGKG